MIKAIAFDYGGVIEQKEGDIIQEIVDHLKVTKEDWNKIYFSLNYLCNTGVNTYLEVARMVAEKLNASNDQILSIQEIIIKYNKKRILNIELIEYIKDLRNKNYKIALLSNYSITLRQKLTDQNIIHLFDEVIIYAEVGFQKPDPEIFEILFNKLDVRNNEVIFIDDTQNSLKNSENIGYIPILYINNKKLKNDLFNIL